MWRPLDKVIEHIPESKWKHFRKWKFKVKFSDPKLNESTDYTDTSKGLRIGKLYRNSPDDCIVNIVPVATPARWFPGSPEELEVYITNEQYRVRVLPIILSE